RARARTRPGTRPWPTSRAPSSRRRRQTAPGRPHAPPRPGAVGRPVQTSIPNPNEPSTPAEAMSRRAWRPRLSARFETRFSPYAFVAPFFLLFFAFGLFPLVYTAWVSLHSVTLQNTEDMTWVGLDNYSRLLHDPLFWNALGNTFTIGVLSTVPQLLMALGLAHVLNYRLRGRTFFRVAMLLPYATSLAAATIVFAELYGRDYGLINWGL